MDVLVLVERFVLGVLHPREPRPADPLRILRILQIEDLERRVAESRLAGCRVVVAGILGPVALVRAVLERTAAPGAAGIRRRALDLGDERDRFRVGSTLGDVEDLEPEILAGIETAN